MLTRDMSWERDGKARQRRVMTLERLVLRSKPMKRQGLALIGTGIAL